MFWCKCFQWSSIANFQPFEPDTFSLPAPLPNWPPGQGFASGRINLGLIEVLKISRFEYIWGCNLSQDEKKGVSFYKPVGIPDGFFTLGHYCQLNNKPLQGFVLAAKDVSSEQESADIGCHVNPPALEKPVDYSLVWCSGDGSQDGYEGSGFFWFPQPPEGYKAMGFSVTSNPGKPDLDEVRCVRTDLTDECQAYRLILDAYSKFSNCPFQVWSTRPSHRGMEGRGVSVGTFFCSSRRESGEEQSIACLRNLDPKLLAMPNLCLRNLDPKLLAMPNLKQLHALIRHYGPMVFFHPHEVYLPSSVSWFFENGALLYAAENSTSEPIDATGDNLPGGGSNDGAFWIDLPGDERRNTVIRGNLESAKLYVHVKPALGGIFTDLAMWVFCPFNGPATLKLGPLSIGLGKIGQHVGDWEHFTLRVCNFSGDLWSIYFSQHSGGKWVEAYDLEYIDGNKAIIYSSKSGHASYPHPGAYLQGSSKLGIGIMNDAAWSDFYIDSSTRYEIIAAEHLEGNDLMEPCWLQFMREWGPRIVYNSRSKLDKIIQFLPMTLRRPVESIFGKFPVELSGEEGPTGPKEKNNWVGDERG